MVSRRKRASSSSPSRVISTPATMIRPAVGRSRPAMSPSSVDLPLPDGPATARNCPGGTSRETSASTSTAAPPLVRRIESPRMLIMTLFILHGLSRASSGSGHAIIDHSMHALAFLDPGHFHAALTLRERHARVRDEIFVYAPAGPELDDFLALI